MTKNKQRFLIVGSLLRPDNLLKYKSEIEHRDDIQYPFYADIDGYKEAEDAAVKTIVDKQVAYEFPEITDGEYSKSQWHLDFIWGIKGIKRFIKEEGYFFRDFDDSSFETRRDIGIKVCDKLDGSGHEFIEHYKRLVDYAPKNSNIKVCIPSPAHMNTELTMSEEVYGDVYDSAEDFTADLIQAYKTFIKEYAEEGGQILQFDDCLWQQYAEDNESSPYSDTAEFNFERAKKNAQVYIDTNNDVVDYAHSLGLKVYTHNCRGNYASRSMSEGSYEAIADFFLKNQNYDRFYLEWDDERAGSLEALKVFEDRPEVEVVLGVLSSKTGELDDEARALSMLEEASKYVPKENLYLSHQCGFASCDGGNELTVDNQWDKIEQGQEIAGKFWR